MTLGAVVMNLTLRATDVQWLATLISATGAFSAEMMNSAIERICDRQCKDYDEDIRYIKDVAAGGVLFWGFAFWLSCLWVIVTTPVFPGLLGRCSSMLATYLCAVLGGASNMLLVKRIRDVSSRHPIDFGHVMPDGRRLFGENKTWVGFFSMGVLCGLWQCAIGSAMRLMGTLVLNDVYASGYASGLLTDFVLGLVIGLSYMLCELPNSFMKRRIGVGAGSAAETESHGLRSFLMLVDYADSPLGTSAVVCLWAGLGIGEYALYVVFGTLLHLVVNVLLVMFGIRKNL